MRLHNKLLLVLSFLHCVFSTSITSSNRDTTETASGKTCVVSASGTNLTDDAPAIRQAFQECGQGGTVAFKNTTYFVNSVLDIRGLRNCTIDLEGTLLWGTNISYWLNNSLPVGYQNQSTAFILGGDNIHFNGHGYGTFNGNGPVWYHFIHGQSNYPGRPHQITLGGLTNSVVEGLVFLQSQMWTMSIINSSNNLLDNIFVNNTGVDGSTSSNTDGADTFFSHNITFSRWTVVNGDDSISMKANSTDISIRNCTFYNGLGIAIGSIGQYKGQFETIQRIRADGIRYINTLHAAYFKTWTGQQVGFPPNGGGGGLGFASDLLFTNLHADEAFRGAPISISQCTTFSGVAGNCTSSNFELENISYANLTGSTSTDTVASLQCSGVKPCHNITIEGVDLIVQSNGTEARDYLCGNVESSGFNCTGPVCVGSSATGGC